MAVLVKLSSATPRDAGSVRKLFDIGHLLRPRAIVGWVLALGGASVLPLAAASCGASPNRPSPLVAIPVVGQLALGVWMLRSVRRIKRTRLRALTRGELRRARVIAHKRRVGLAILLRRFDTVVELELRDADGSVHGGRARSPLSTIRKAMPLGREVDVLFDRATGAMFAPAEMDRRVELADGDASGCSPDDPAARVAASP